MRIRYASSFAVLLFAAAALAATAATAPAGWAASLSENAAQRADAVSGATPTIDPLSDMTVLVNETADQTVHAADADGDPLSFSKAFGPAYMTVGTTDPGTGNATGTIHLAPGASDAGLTTGGVAVTDGVHTNQRSFSIRVTTPEVAPVLDPLNDMTVEAGHVETQALRATDSNGDALEFSIVSGPSYVTATTDDPGVGTATGFVRVGPGASVEDTATVVVGVSDGIESDQKSFFLTVTKLNVAPILAIIADVSLRAGEQRDIPIYATDSNGDPLVFSKTAGPSYMTVTTTDPGQGSASGAMHFSPGPSEAGSFTATVTVSDGYLTSSRSFALSVRANSAPSLNYVYDMQVRAGEYASQYIYSTDPDGDLVRLTKVSGPLYMIVTEFLPSGGNAYGEIRLNPLATDVGTATGVVMASDGALFTQRSFNITVLPPNRAPVMTQPQNMTASAGEQVEQPISATDPDGDYVYMYKGSAPNFLSLDGYGNYGTANYTIRLNPTAADIGDTSATIVASDNYATVSKGFLISVTGGNFPPPCPASTFLSRSVAFGYGTIEVQTADLNGDGIADLVVELAEGGKVKVALGVGDGTFGTPADLFAGAVPVSGAIADFNRDDVPDLAIVNTSNDNVSIFLGDGAGAFGPRRDFGVGDGPRTIVAADINRDGKVDLLVTNVGSYLGSVSILRGVGDGTFVAGTTLATGSAAWGIAAPDLTGDGAPDVVVTNPQVSTFSVFLNNGFGSFGPRTEVAGGPEAYGVAAGDLNGDGKTDLAVSNSYPYSVSVLLGTGTGTFELRRVYSAGYNPRQLVITDMNGDGHADVAVVNLNGYNASIFLGNGTGSLGPRTDIPAQSSPYGIAVGDFDDDLRNDLAIANYYSGSVTLLLNQSCAPDVDHPPVVKAPRSVAAAEGTQVAFSITASDPDGPNVTGLTASFAGLPLGNNATFTPSADFTAGAFAWTPTYLDARPTPYPVTFTATNVISGSAMTKITVANTNRAPVANAGGPYVAFTGVPLTFDGSLSSDPDGEALSYLWFFGDGATGMGAHPAHTYVAIGVYGVALSVTDGLLTSLSTTTATIVGVYQARAFTAAGNRSIRLTSGKPQWSVELEPVARAYSNAMVDLASLVMKSPGTGSVGQISAVVSKTVAGSDRDGNGVEEITVSFDKDDLRLLFSNMHGSGSATVTIEGSLFTGGVIRASLDVGIVAGGGSLAASVNPNPLNPSAILTFYTSKPGPVRIRAYDPQGRLVRTMLHDPVMTAGYHDVALDGRDDRGTALASGVYYYRLEAAEGVTTGRFTVLR